MTEIKFQHKDLARGRWQELTLAEQMGNIGSEISRADKWRDKDQSIFNNAVDRALELFDLTLDDSRHKGRLKEIARTREIFCDAIFGEKQYKTTLTDLLRYFNQFVYLNTP